MCFIFCGLLILLSLWTYNIKDPTLNQSVSGAYVVQNAAGMFGAYLAGFLTDMFGFAAYVWPIFFIASGTFLVARWLVVPWWRWLGYIALWGCTLTGAESLSLGIGDVRGGGVLGAWVYARGHALFSPAGFSLLWIFFFLVGLRLSFSTKWLSKLFGGLSLGAKATEAQLKKVPLDSVGSMLTRLHLPSFLSRSQHSDALVKDMKGIHSSGTSEVTMETINMLTPEGKKKSRKNRSDLKILPDINIGPSPDPAERAAPQQELLTNAATLKDKLFAKVKGDKSLQDGKNAAANGTAEPKKPAQPSPASLLPSLDLLKDVPLSSEATQPNQQLLQVKAQALMTCLQDFGVEGSLARITPGPVVTMFEVRPGRSVKANRIANLADEIAMAMKAVAVRIQAPIPGTDAVGVEIPNEHRALVSFRELLEDDSFAKSNDLLTMALGKDISGHAVSADLARMPHLLVAGATGAGKSVCLNAIIISLLYRAAPSQMQLLLIDPKRVELAIYADLPHLVHPVVTEMDLAKNALLWAIEEMNRRYTLLGQVGVRNMADFNKRIAEFEANPASRPADLEGVNAQPMLVIIIDELADLMLTKGKEVETSIVRLAQLARAAGMHLIVATQRPSVDVVTGLIKTNFLCRIAFQMTSGHDSRTILDSTGAETLLGKGDMLFKPSAGKLMRLHGPFVCDSEVTRVVNHWKSKQKPDYQLDFSTYQTDAAPVQPADARRNDVVDDPIYAEAVQFVREQGRVSISLLQRRFRVGFNRAARYKEQMEQDGILPAKEN